MEKVPRENSSSTRKDAESPSSTLLVEGLPGKLSYTLKKIHLTVKCTGATTEQMLSILFKQFVGFVEIRIDKPDKEGIGEIVVKNKNCMSGYLNVKEEFLDNGWFYTGDAAVVHNDGYLEIRDRFKDVIISGGENISSVEVEGCLLHHPAILEVAVVGMPHEKWGEAPHAFVVLQSGQSCTKDQLRRHVRENLAHFKTPQWFSFVEDLPKTATGKVQKFVLRDGKAGISAQ